MKHSIHLLIILLLACDNNYTPPLPELPSDAVVLAFGDSLTYGTGANHESSYPNILGKNTGLTVINAGKPGETSEEALTRLPMLLNKHNPDLLILIHGGNDMLRKLPQNTTVTNLKSMIETTQKKGIAIIMLGVPKPNLLGLESADFYLKTAQQYEVPIDLDILPRILNDSSLKSDMIHPNAEGYRQIADAIEQMLIASGGLSKI